MDKSTGFVDRLFALWTVPPPEQQVDAVATFRDVYADLVLINGVPTPVVDLIARQHAPSGLRRPRD